MESRKSEKNHETRTGNKMKTIKVGFLDEKIKNLFEKLKNGKFEDRELHKFLERAFEDIKKDPEIGISIPKNLIPK